jgi:hypothetical protein
VKPFQGRVFVVAVTGDKGNGFILQILNQVDGQKTFTDTAGPAGKDLQRFFTDIEQSTYLWGAAFMRSIGIKVPIMDSPFAIHRAQSRCFLNDDILISVLTQHEFVTPICDANYSSLFRTRKHQEETPNYLQHFATSAVSFDAFRRGERRNSQFTTR